MPHIAIGIRKGVAALGITTIALSTLCLGGCEEKVKPGTAEVQRQAVEGVTIQEIKPVSVDEYSEASGTVKAKNTTIIASRVIGTVTSLSVKEGDRVGGGQVLMTIDDRDSAARMDAADAGRGEAQKTLDAARQNKALLELTYGRYKKLHDEKAISQQEMDEIETKKRVADIECQRAEDSLKRAKAGVQEAEVNRGFSKIRAPFPGTVTAKQIDKGSMAVPGAPLLTIEDGSAFRIEANLDEKLSGKVKPGMPVEVLIDALGRTTQGTVSEVVPAIDPATRTFLVKISLSGDSLRSGLYAKILLPVGKKEALLVPRKAIVQKGELTGVYTTDDKGVITYRLIRQGKTSKDMVEILSGLNAGERVVVDGVEKAVDGGVVKTSGK